MKSGIKKAVAVSAMALMISGCGGITIPYVGQVGGGEHFVYTGHDFGADRNEDYKKGVMDGCKTAQGDYMKNHELFQSNDHYRAGWEHGRLHCAKGAPAHD